MKPSVRKLYQRVSSVVFAFVLTISSVSFASPFLFSKKVDALNSSAWFLVASPSATTDVAQGTDIVTITVKATSFDTELASPIDVTRDNTTISASVASGSGIVTDDCTKSSSDWTNSATAQLVNGDPAIHTFCYIGNALGLQTINFSSSFPYIIGVPPLAFTGYNTPSTSVNVSIVDKTAPAIAVHADINMPATSSAGTVVDYTAPLVTDNIDPSASAVCLPVSGSTFPIGTTVVNCSKTDNAGNIATSNFKITVEDEGIPVITLSDYSPIVIEAGDSYVPAVATAFDVVDGDITSKIVVTSSVISTVVGDYTTRYNVSDTAGNPAVEVVRNVTVKPRQITVQADNQSKVYGEIEPVLSHQITSGSLMSGDSFTGSLIRASGEDVASYAVYQGTLALNSNYVVTYFPGNFEITPAYISVIANPVSKVYGENDPIIFTFTITSGAKVGSDDFSGFLSRAPGENAGTYGISQGTLALSSNYYLDFVSSDFTITKAPITVTADEVTSFYGMSDPILTYQFNPLDLKYTSDTFTGTLSRVAGNHVGSYLINQGTLTLGDNYEITFVGSNFKINKAKVTVTADGITKIFGAYDPTLTYKVTFGSLFGTDKFIGLLSRVTGETVGIYNIKIGTFAISDDYEITFIAGKFAITPAPTPVPAPVIWEDTTSTEKAQEVMAAIDTTGSIDDEAAATDVKSATTKKDDTWKIIGLAWYWWLLILAVAAYAWWFVAAKDRREK